MKTIFFYFESFDFCIFGLFTCEAFLYLYYIFLTENQCLDFYFISFIFYIFNKSNKSIYLN